MTVSLSIFKNCIPLSLSVFFINSCANEPEKRRPKSHTVEIKKMKFQPAELIVQKEDTVVWINNDILAHDVTEESNKRWTSELIPAGKSWSLIVTESADYYCTIHVVMKGKLIVQ